MSPFVETKSMAQERVATPAIKRRPRHDGDKLMLVIKLFMVGLMLVYGAIMIASA